MKFTKTIFTIFAIFFTVSIIFLAQSACAQGTQTNDLNLTKEECKTLGGKWNECPANECQKTEAYKTGKVICPQVCGEPQCQGLVPKEEEDLSNIHNVDLKHQPVIRGQDTKNSQSSYQKQVPKEKEEVSGSVIKPELTGEQKLTEEQTEIKLNRLTIYLILGFILLLIFVVLRYKSRVVK